MSEINEISNAGDYNLLSNPGDFANAFFKRGLGLLGTFESLFFGEGRGDFFYISPPR